MSDSNAALLKRLGLSAKEAGVFATSFEATGDEIDAWTPIDGDSLGVVIGASEADYERVIAAAQAAFETWRVTPAPQRGEIVRQIGDALRAAKDDLGMLVTVEMGKSKSEGLGEVQEMIDMADLAVGMSRQLCGNTMHSERPGHRMFEQWHPIGPVGVISAFNFPVAVYAWNALVSLICGNPVVWKPSPKTAMVSVATIKIIQSVLAPKGLQGLCTLMCGGADLAEKMADDKRLPLISATGSCEMGRSVAGRVAGRLGRTLLELGGNNAAIVLDDADLELALRAVLFGAVGTAGQRCTSTRRLLVHKDIYADVRSRLIAGYETLRVGDPRDESNHVGPLIDLDSVAAMQNAVAAAKEGGATVLFGGGIETGAGFESGCYVRPCLIEASRDFKGLREEVFAPILYLVSVDDVADAIALQNDVPQGLSSAVFTTSIKNAERFLNATGSDCGIANVNAGTSGAEIGGAFGGEKDTGGGREAGSDAWKAYMRRQTCTMNYGDDIPLAQGVRFG